LKSTGNNMEARMPMIATTQSNSIRLKPTPERRLARAAGRGFDV
jgi:hypothetical protein